MENFSYATSYPESDSSPRSRDIDFDNPPPPWEDNSTNYRVKFMCSYGGKITPRPHDNHLSYVGGETKILAVDRTVKFSGLIAKISALCEADICFKYQLPGEDLDALISVTNDDDLQHMMHEYDRLNRASSPKPARLRLFLFPVSGSTTTACFLTPAQSFGSNASEGRSERDKFVEALNSGPVQPPEIAAAAATNNNNVDFLFGLEKGMPPPVVAAAKHEPITDPAANLPEVMVPTMYRRKAEENFTGEYYGQQKATENVPPPTLPGQANGYWPEKQIHGGVYTPANTMMSDQQMYMIQAPSNMYHAAPMAARPPVTGPVGQGYYAVQRMPPTEFYREQPIYTQQQQQQQLQSATTQPTLQQQQLPAGYTQVAAYDGGANGRQVYYTAQGGVVVAQPQPPTAAQYQAAMAAGNFNQDGGNVVPAKVTQAAV